MVSRRRYLRTLGSAAALPTAAAASGCVGFGASPTPTGTPVENRPADGRSTVGQFQADARNGGAVDPSGPTADVEPYWRRTPAKYDAGQPVVTGDAVFVLFAGTLVSLDREDGDPNWRTRVGHDGESTPAVHDGTVYATVWNGGEGVDRGLAAVDADSGEVLWRAATELDVTSSPTVTDGGVFLGGGYENETVVAVDHDGAERWRADLGEYASTPAVRDGTVHAAGGETNALVAYDAETGEERRRTDLDGRATAAPTVAGSDVLVGDESGTLSAFDAASGEPSWTTDAGGPVAGSPAVADDAVIAPVEGALVALERADRSERWRAPVAAEPTAPFVAGDACYVAARRAVHAFGLADGDELWSFGTRERNYTDVVLAGVSAPVAAVDGVVFVATQAGDVYALGEA
ncbi:outer membrane protein assembly factor BamB family protein [Halorarum salinum]|uniref:PQQ-binding-like beta-propeller repeat protein n=1 Tax=Halorarum salinum TaxID=2743089 RepID=A0A7D5LCQ0_9EURY|nr:PQQ-binding-like beta-propeller repeat protein [Halobaculum salinum]QLG63713.1 PQQ-binding-like beta-propeller repeat protein [Halobaculum salinum]